MEIEDASRSPTARRDSGNYSTGQSLLSVPAVDGMYSDPPKTCGSVSEFRGADAAHCAWYRLGKIGSFLPRRNNACGGPRGRAFELLWNWPGPSLMCVLWHRLEIVIAHILYRCELEIVFHCLIADVVIHITLHIL